MTTEFCAPVAPRPAFRRQLRQRVLSEYPVSHPSFVPWLLAPLSVLGLLILVVYIEMSPFWSPAEYFADQAFMQEIARIEKSNAI